MIEEMRMQGLGVIADAVLPLGPGFTAITGETGAGKTMVVTGLGLLLGQRADSGAVRAGAAQASVAGVWIVHRRVSRAAGPPSRSHPSSEQVLLHQHEDAVGEGAQQCQQNDRE
uniref:AAA family ATPase n=1 Tax=Microbacterium sp. BF1 TaxID=2821146 RepID=UPI00211A1F8B